MSKLDIKTTVTLSSEKISQYIKAGLKGDGYKVLSEPLYKSGSRLEGHAMMEHNVNYFDGCTVEVTPFTSESS